MNKLILCCTALILASPAYSGESRINTTRDSGGYEATLRLAGVPLSGGMAWYAHKDGSSAIAPVLPASHKQPVTDGAVIKAR